MFFIYFADPLFSKATSADFLSWSNDRKDFPYSVVSPQHSKTLLMVYITAAFPFFVLLLLIFAALVLTHFFYQRLQCLPNIDTPFSFLRGQYLCATIRTALMTATILASISRTSVVTWTIFASIIHWCCSRRIWIQNDMLREGFEYRLTC